ncbi:hypothetical protein QLQ12_09215 [Actinoplanes sp. NEAU-A12]|uniref:DUF5666 domain-containing protein n=1 Tax=Actinoplanes sandaracinus TaxID=3045177 RepID=A0ABT6WGC6_9ACTN|nr:hypothetical protein [Actinoplanes sandaracinus]MDI6098777.1 hypothetical protein [Actinoplanes sandaracinus]
MRRLTILLLAGGSLAPLTACGSDPPPGSASPAPSPPATAPGAGGTPPAPVSPAGGTPPAPVSPAGGTPPAPVSPGSPAPTTTTPPPASPRGESTVPVPPPGPGELPGGLPHGDRTLSGVVARSGDCTMLRVGDRLWGLAGTPAETLTAGDRVTVTGQITTTGADCAGSDVVRTIVVRRVTPGG